MLTIKQITEDKECVIRGLEKKHFQGAREAVEQVIAFDNKRKAAQAKIEAGKKKIEWGSQIRSYVFDDRRVKDHRTGFQTSDVGGVMDGKIDGFIKAYLMEFSEKGADEN